MLRGNKFINYEQLGLTYTLYSCVVMFNRGLCHIYLLQKDLGMADLRAAAKEKETAEHDVIDEAIQEGPEVRFGSVNERAQKLLKSPQEFTVFSVGVGTIYRPNVAKVKNLKAKDYLGKARLISSSGGQKNYYSSSDAKKAALAAAAERARGDGAPDTISYSASNLVRPGLHSKSRQQSEPPINRNMFPPTPPPEAESLRPAPAPMSTSPPSKPPMNPTRSQASHPLRPEPLNLEKSSFASLSSKEAPRIGTQRTASEPRGPSKREPSRRLFNEVTPARRQSNGDGAYVEGQQDDISDVHPAQRETHFSNTDIGQRPQRPSSRPRHSHRSRSRPRRDHYSIAEEDETGGASSSPSSLDESEKFEILNNAGGDLSRPPANPAVASRPRQRSPSRRAGSRTRSRRPTDLRNMRIKVHCNDDTRYIMLSPEVSFESFIERVREKFGLKQAFKMKTRDEGDLITMGDGDDWEMAIGAVRKEMHAEMRKVDGDGGYGSGSEAGMGKMEVWVVEAS